MATHSHNEISTDFDHEISSQRNRVHKSFSLCLCGLCERLSRKTQRPGRPKMELVKIICAVLLPPLGVFFQVGIGKHFWINIILTLLGYIPGIVHAIWVIAKKK